MPPIHPLQCVHIQDDGSQSHNICEDILPQTSVKAEMSKLTCMSFSLSRPPWPSRMFNIGLWCSVPRAENKGSLGYIPIMYVLLHYSIRFDFPLIHAPKFLLSPCLRLPPNPPTLISLGRSGSTDPTTSPVSTILSYFPYPRISP